MTAGQKYDVLVIGGGINGLGIASDAAQRGLRVLIVEKTDWGSGTSSASSRLIHGGLRYLQYGEIDLVRESLRERGILTRQRPHLVHPIQLLIPTFAGMPTPKWMVGAGLVMYDLLARDALFPHPSILSLAKTRQREPGLNTEGLSGGYIYPDAQIEFPERICVELMQEARKAGADVRNHSKVTALTQVGKRVTGATVRDELTGREETVTASMTINAAGPWLDVVNRTLSDAPPRLIGGTWGTHLILPMRPQGPQGPIYATAKKDGRPFFLLPWDGRLLVGTTDVKFIGDNPDRLEMEAWEVDYLLEESNHLFPAAGYKDTDVEEITVGIRPLPASDKKAGAVSRRHFLVDHREKQGIEGLASIVGGKLTTYRSLAQEAVDWTLKALGKPAVPCTTGHLPAHPLLVPALITEAQTALANLHLPTTLAPRLIALYGPAFASVLDRIADDPTLGKTLGPRTEILEAQIVHAAQSEEARTIDDIVHRRLMLFPPTPEAVEGVRRICRERNLLREGALACPA